MVLLHDTAHAKINLFLHMTGRRDDGYHFVDSIAIFAGAADRLSLDNASSIDGEIAALTLDGPFSSGLTEEKDNLITRAAQLLYNTARQHGHDAAAMLPITFHLHKSLPIASGIGGGSADAACALRLLCNYWQIPHEQAIQIAPKLGADVAVCLAQHATRMEGIGEILTPIPSLPPIGMILVNPGVPVSTPAIFKRLAETSGIPKRDPLSLPAEGWHSIHDLVAFLKTTDNDLQPHAIAQEPIIQTVLDTLQKLPGVRFTRMSGSGATCFALFDNEAAAHIAYQELLRSEHAPSWWCWSGSLA